MEGPAVRRPRPDGVEWSGELGDLKGLPEGAPLLLHGRLAAGLRDASFVGSPGRAWARHVAVVTHVYRVGRGMTTSAAACEPGRIMLCDYLDEAAAVREQHHCRRPACAALFARADREAGS